MTKQSNKKGFTIVELVIVIAVIAVLAAVLIPTFVNLVDKANEANDTALIKNLNTALAADTDGCNTMSEALEAAAAFGYDVAKIEASASNNTILWDSVNNVFCYLKDGNIEYISDDVDKQDNAAYWIIADKPDAKYSTYLYNYNGDGTETVATGLDAGVCELDEITYENNGTASVIIRTNGGKLVVKAPDANVKHYGEADEVQIVAVADASYHEFGKAGYTEVTKGRYVMEKSGSTIALVVVGDDAKVGNLGGKIVAQYKANKAADGSVNIEAGDDSVNVKAAEVGATVFAGGLGTDTNPYLIETADHLKNVATLYESGYNYFKVADGVETIDCSNWPQNIYLNGSFNGNGVKLVNLSYALFNRVGYKYTEQDMTIENFTVTVKSNTALVHNIYNGGETTFKDIQMHGYIEAKANTGSFFRYGPGNSGDGGCDYIVNFVNCQSDATIVDTTTNIPAALFGNAYEGDGHKVIIKIDDKTAFNGILMGTAQRDTGRYYGLLHRESEVYVAGERVSNDKTYANYVKFEPLKAEKADDGTYTIQKGNGVTSMKVEIMLITTAYYADGNKVADQSGINGLYDSKILTELSDTVTVLGAFDDNKEFEWKTGAAERKVEIVDNVLKIYSDLSATYTYDVKVVLLVTQYDSTGRILSTGSTEIANLEH